MMNVLMGLLHNMPAILSILSGLLGVVVMIMHLAHKEDVAKEIADIQAVLDNLSKPKV